MQTTANALMRAVRVHNRGTSGILTFEDVLRPHPGEGEILVRVMATSVNHVDWESPAVPFIPGRDVSGVVETVGTGVTRFQEGDEVYGLVNGAYAQFAVGKESELARKPWTIDHLHSAAIPLAALTAWQALFETAGIHPGHRVLIHGAAGGVGSFAVQLAKWRGATVAGTASSRNRSFLSILGVDESISYEKSRFENLVRNADVVLDTLGGDVQQRSWKVLRKGGMLVSTVTPPSHDDAENHAVRSAMVITRPDAAQLAKIADLFDRGSIRPIVETILPLSEAKHAHDLSEAGHVRGKIVLSVV